MKHLWTELGGQDQADRVKNAGNWITYVSQILLPELAQYRREQVNQALESKTWDAQKLAETIGARTGTINRLNREWRRGQS